jgi:hypothetical protein
VSTRNNHESAMVQLNTAMRDAQVELLSARCATDRLRLRYSIDEIVQKAPPELLFKAINTVADLHEYYSRIEKKRAHTSRAPLP